MVCYQVIFSKYVPGYERDTHTLYVGTDLSQAERVKLDCECKGELQREDVVYIVAWQDGVWRCM